MLIINNVLIRMIGMAQGLMFFFLADSSTGHLGDAKEIPRPTAELHQKHLRWKSVLSTTLFNLVGWTWDLGLKHPWSTTN